MRNRRDCKNFPYLSYHGFQKEAKEYNVKLKVNHMVLFGAFESTVYRHTTYLTV